MNEQFLHDLADVVKNMRNAAIANGNTERVESLSVRFTRDEAVIFSIRSVTQGRIDRRDSSYIPFER